MIVKPPTHYTPDLPIPEQLRGTWYMYNPNTWNFALATIPQFGGKAVGREGRPTYAVTREIYNDELPGVGAPDRPVDRPVRPGLSWPAIYPHSKDSNDTYIDFTTPQDKPPKIIQQTEPKSNNAIGGILLLTAIAGIAYGYYRWNNRRSHSRRATQSTESGVGT